MTPKSIAAAILVTLGAFAGVKNSAREIHRAIRVRAPDLRADERAARRARNKAARKARKRNRE